MSATLETSALVSRAPGLEPRVEPILVDPPGAGEVRVRVRASGICHTDLLVSAGRSWWPDHPYVLGHEGAGVIESVGPGVDPERIGQGVLLAWKAPCGRCRFCAAGRAWLCVDPPRAPGRIRLADGTSATPSLRVGSHAGLAVVPETAAIDLPADLAPEHACLLGCAVLTGVGAVRNTAGVQAGQTVAVFGCGGVGLSIVAGARMAGASTIIAVDPSAARAEAAGRMGATEVVQRPAGEAVRAILEHTGGHGVDHAFDAVGRGDVLVDALGCLDTGGTAILVGTPEVTDAATIPLELAYLQRLTLRVSQYGDVLPARDAPWLAERCLDGDLDLRPLLSRVLEPHEAPAGLAALRSGDAIRSLIRFPDP